MFDNRNGEDPDDDNDTLRYWALTGVGGTWMWACQTSQSSQEVRNDTTGPRDLYYLNGRLAMWVRVAAKVQRRPRARFSGASRSATGANPVQRLSRCASRDAMGTYLSVEVAIRLAMSEYLHVDCRLMQAKQ